ncbi:hypothetical protein [Luteolibacter sp. AS25]|uniref:hypothetical protein n=1 Tax=Luteolibacter sp. AS25 TaxID=3135776 RepID=UPI00398B17A7
MKISSKFAKAVVVTGVAISVVIATSFLILSFKPQADSSPTATRITAESVPVENLPEDPEAAALEVLEEFFEASDLEGKSRFVREPKRVLPMMRDFYEVRQNPFPTLGRVSAGQISNFGDSMLVLFQIEPFTGGIYSIAVAWEGDRFAVDWLSFSSYGTMNWDEFTDAKPGAAQTMRLYIMNGAELGKPPGLPDNYPNLQIEHRDFSQPLQCFVAPNLLPAFKSLIGRNKRVPVTIEVGWKKLTNDSEPVPYISHFITEGWSN